MAADRPSFEEWLSKRQLANLGGSSQSQDTIAVAGYEDSLEDPMSKLSIVGEDRGCNDVANSTQDTLSLSGSQDKNELVAAVTATPTEKIAS